MSRAAPGHHARPPPAPPPAPAWPASPARPSACARRGRSPASSRGWSGPPPAAPPARPARRAGQSLTSAAAARPSSEALPAIASATATMGPSSTTVTSSVIRMAASARRPPTARSSQRKAGQLVETRIAAHTSAVRKGHNTSTQPAPSRARARMGRTRSELKFGMGVERRGVGGVSRGIMRLSPAGLEFGAVQSHGVPYRQRRLLTPFLTKRKPGVDVACDVISAGTLFLRGLQRLGN
jgi:hypothetical protein